MRERLFIWSVGALFAGGVLGAFSVDAITSYRERITAAERETHNMAALLAEQTRQLLSDMSQTLSVAARAYDDWHVDPRRSAETGYRMLKAIEGSSVAVRGLAWIDKDGHRVATSLSPDPPAINIAARPHFTVHRDTANVGMYLAAPFHAMSIDAWLTIASRRIDAPDGSFAGIASAILNTDYLAQVFEHFHLLGQVDVSLYRRDGSAITHFPARIGPDGRSGRESQLFRNELPRADRGTYHARGARDGVPRIYSYHSVAGHPLVINVAVPRAAALGPWLNRIRLTGAISFLAIFGALAATALIARQARRLHAERMKALEARFAAEDASRSKSEFLAHMSHELRTPMNAIIGFTDMMTKEVFGPIGSPKYREYLNDIAVSGQHLLQVVNNVLDLAKVEAGRWEMEECDIDLRALCLTTVQIVRERARAAGVAIEVAEDSPDVVVRADPRLLRQILLNLIINGIKFSDSGGRVRIIWLIHARGGLVLAVSDTGAGMSPDDARRVLQPFGRGSAYLARSRHETGLGLPLCKRFVEMHGGSLAIASAIGSGTTVTVELPPERIRSAAALAPAA